MELENFDEALEALIASGAENYGDGESIEELHRLSSRSSPSSPRPRAAFEAGEQWAADGAKTAAAWIATRCRVPRAAAQRRVRLGRTLRHLPAVAEAWRDGAIGEDAAQAIASARRHRTEAAMARDEEMLVAQAKELGFEDFSRVLAYWKQLADPDGAEASDEERKASRDVFLTSSFDGMWLGQMTLDPINGSIVSGELNRFEHDLFEADCAEAKERLGRPAGSTSWPGPRASAGPTPWWRWPPRSRTAPAEGIRPAPLFSASWSASRPCTGASASSRTAPCSTLRPSSPGWTRPTSSGPSSPWATASTSACARASSTGGPAGHRAARPHLHPPPLLRARRELPGGPHRDLRLGRAHHPGQRPAPLWLPQPPAQPARARRGEQRQRPPPSAA